MMDTWEKYRSERTVLGVSFFKGSSIGEGLLPCITICPWEAFKKPGFFYTNEDYDKNTFKRNEVFFEG
jgi:hypothetical protein